MQRSQFVVTPLLTTIHASSKPKLRESNQIPAYDVFHFQYHRYSCLCELLYHTTISLQYTKDGWTIIPE